MIRLVSLDIAGTALDEGGTVYRVLADALAESLGRPVPADVLSRFSGTSKREAMLGIVAALGEDAALVEAAYPRFLDALVAAYEDDPPRLVDGAGDAIDALRSAGVAVALQTGYPRSIAEPLVTAAGLVAGERIDALVTDDDVPASRPAPFLVFGTMTATGVDDVADVLVAGDTVNDLLAGTRSGASHVVGVLTGAHDALELGRAPHTHLLASVAGIPELLGI